MEVYETGDFGWLIGIGIFVAPFVVILVAGSKQARERSKRRAAASNKPRNSGVGDSLGVASSVLGFPPPKTRNEADITEEDFGNTL